MKRILSVILALALALSLTAAFAETPAAEETAPETAAPAFDPQALVDEAAADLLGIHMEVIGLVAVSPFLEDIELQVFLCRITTVSPNPDPRFGVVIIAVDPDGEAGVLGTMDMPYTEDDGSPTFPGAEEMRDEVYVPIAELPEGSAGAALQKAQRTMQVLLVAGVYAFDRMEPEALANLLAEAAAGLTEEEQAACAANAPAIIAELQRLCDPNEELGDVYADAGVAEVTEALRADPAVQASLAALLAALAN